MKTNRYWLLPLAICWLSPAGIFVPVCPGYARPDQFILPLILPLLLGSPANLKSAIEESMTQAIGTAPVNIPALLQSGNYKEAQEKLLKLQADAEASVEAERELVKALWVITDLIDQDLAPLYEEWIRRYPDSFAPYLAYGVYHTSLAWKFRGGRYGNKLTKSQIENMFSEFRLAIASLEKAQTLNPRLVVSYAYQIDAYKSICATDEIESLKNIALSIQPNSWWVRALYFHAMAPRWCGSLGKMQSFLNETLPYIQTNPNLAYLQGRVAFEQAEEMTIMSRHPKYAEALPLYSEALSYGDYFSYRLGRATALMKLHRYTEAIVDLQAAIKDRPTDYELHEKLAEARSKQ